MLITRSICVVALAVISAGCGSAAGDGTSSITSAADAGKASPSPATAPRFAGPGIDGVVVVAARRRDGGPAADLYELRGRPLSVRRLTHTSDRRGVATFNATKDGALVGADLTGHRQEVRVVEPTAPSGIGRVVGRGFEGSVGPGGKVAAVLRRSPGASGYPLIIALKALHGSKSERIVMKERREIGGPTWGPDGDLLVPALTAEGSEVVRNPGSKTERHLSLPNGFKAAGVVAGPNGNFAVADPAQEASVLLDRNGRLLARKPLRNALVLAWSPDGRRVLIATDDRQRLQVYERGTGRRTLIAELPDGDMYQGAWGALPSPAP